MALSGSRTPDAVVGIGASAGGIEPLCTVVGALKPELPAAVLVVVHLNASAPTVLDGILTRCGTMPAVFAVDGMALETGRVYVGPPDHHMTVEDGRIVLSRTPTVNAVRPSIDVLFRSLAAAYGRRCVGVILSGTLDDGAAGLLDIKQAGGGTIVQDPAEAVFAGMPMSACEIAHPQEVAAADRIADLIVDTLDAKLSPSVEAEGEGVAPMADPSTNNVLDDPPPGRPSELACPDCSGVLWEEPSDPLVFRCRIGHAYSPESLASRHSQKLESALWSAVVALEERADLFRRVARRQEGRGNPGMRRRYEQGADKAVESAAVLRRLVLGVEGPPLAAD